MSNKEKVVDLETASMIKDGWIIKSNYSEVIVTPGEKILKEYDGNKNDPEINEIPESFLSTAAAVEVGLMNAFHEGIFKDKNDLFLLTSHNNPQDIQIFNIETQKFIGYMSFNGFFGQEIHFSPLADPKVINKDIVSVELYIGDRIPIVFRISGISKMHPVAQTSFFIISFISSMMMHPIRSHNKLSEVLMDCASVVNREKITNIEL